MGIEHVVVLMLENRSFDSVLGKLHDGTPGFDGLTGAESNIWHRPDGTTPRISVWNEPGMDPTTATIPTPDPGELFTDIAVQIAGLDGASPMGGFVDNYMRQPGTVPRSPHAVMHYFTPGQLPVLSTLATAFGMSDRWFASAPCQTWPNRFFAHCGTAGGWVNNSPPRFPYTMPTVFNLLDAAAKEWRIYFHDVPQSATLTQLWSDPVKGFRRFGDFLPDAANGDLPAYSFIEPRYFTDMLLGQMPNDEHPPHNILYGEMLIASVYNALRAGPRWAQTLLVVTYDEHGGCYDHVTPPPATPPGPPYGNGFTFDRFGPRVPAVLISPFIAANSIIRPPGTTPFDHTSIIATLRRLFGIGALTARDAAAPDLLHGLTATPDNNGPERIEAPVVQTTAAALTAMKILPPNDIQQGLAAAAAQLPTAGSDPAVHARRVATAPTPVLTQLAAAAEFVKAHVGAFLGEL
jgi:phospholipase C